MASSPSRHRSKRDRSRQRSSHRSKRHRRSRSRGRPRSRSRSRRRSHRSHRREHRRSSHRSYSGSPTPVHVVVEDKPVVVLDPVGTIRPLTLNSSPVPSSSKSITFGFKPSKKVVRNIKSNFRLDDAPKPVFVEVENVLEQSEEVDPLEAYMDRLNTTEQPEKLDKYYDDELVNDEMGAVVVQGTEDLSWMKKSKTLKKKEIKPVDHSQMDYINIRKDFYIEASEITSLTDDQVKSYLLNELEGTKVRGKNVPRPIMKWTQAGLPARVLEVIDQSGYAHPFPIQSQAIPCIMSGRDCIGVAKTGSGKTLAFLLPMIRHILDQPALAPGDGPIGLILAPTRELAIQIGSEARKFSKPVGLRMVCCYGGTGVADQIAHLKRGCEIVVATPGRMIDMLSANHGRITNLRRTSFLVLDEADRMFDMGFEPQISAILMNIRPDKQTVMFSATFPRQIEGLAKKALKRPVEIIVGGRSITSDTIDQIIEVIDERSKFNRLLDIIKDYGSILIFADKQEAVDILFGRLMKAGYMCLALHGGMDQTDRDYTIQDFKKGVRSIMIATSVAARGIDIKNLALVVNYSVPNHYEDYVHRVGRTGRAGKKGTAITFITPEEERYSLDLVKALEITKTAVPDDLKKLAEQFEMKTKSGVVKFTSNSGYSGAKGFKFDEKEAMKKFEDQKRQKITFGMNYDDDEDDDDYGLFGEPDVVEQKEAPKSNVGISISEQIALAKKAAAAAKEALTDRSSSTSDKLKEAMNIKEELASVSIGEVSEDIFSETYHCEEFEVNDYPQQVRWKVTSKDSLRDIQEWCDVAITTRGSYFASNRKASGGERKLYLVIEGKSRISVMRAIKEIKRVIEEAMLDAEPEANQYNKYNVL